MIVLKIIIALKDIKIPSISVKKLCPKNIKEIVKIRANRKRSNKEPKAIMYIII